jgi:penicillin-binding protein 1A
VLSVSYPKGMMERLREKGIGFTDPSSAPDTDSGGPDPSGTSPLPAPNEPRIEMRRPPRTEDQFESARVPIPEPTRTFERTPLMKDPLKGSEASTPHIPYLPPPKADQAHPVAETAVPNRDQPVEPPAEQNAAAPIAPPLPRMPTAETEEATEATEAKASPTPRPVRRIPTNNGRPAAVQPNSLIRRLFKRGMFAAAAAALLGGLAIAGVFTYFSGDLPTVQALGEYDPPTVTVVYDSKGAILGEIYEKRRYVVPLKQIPDHVTNAFLASEDANFWKHDGIDVGGIFRAVLRNVLKGKKAQGASTITQQVARNFLLTREKTFIRKIREIILAQRVEEAFEKEHILYLYLNQIYLGSGAYGVEAAARTYFDKNVEDINLGEAAILAGLPQRPSDYSPHRHWKKARARQMYVLDQMLDKGFIDQATYDTTVASSVRIAPKKNDFLQQAPYFTEHVRRYLVDTYGFDKIYNDGLSVNTTCDLELQQAAQKALVDGVNIAGNRRGWRGPKAQIAQGSIQSHRDALEEELRNAESLAHLTVGSTEPGAPNEGGYAPVPKQSTLKSQMELEGVVLGVKKDHAIVGIGSHKAIVPLAWSKWAYPIDVERSWKYRAQNSMHNVLKNGDVVDLRIVTADAKEEDETQRFAMQVKGPVAAAELVQSPELQGALFSYRFDTGAVTAMVGGVDFNNSEYNRATQAQRQVGSTFKPIVYATAIGSKKFTAASMVQDAPTIIGEAGGTMWKPSNYGGEYLGNITLRRALAMSRNVCTVRVLDVIGPDSVYEVAGPKLGIGFPEPTCSRTHTSIENECIGTRSSSNVKGMSWCENCDPASCPTVRIDELFSGDCMGEAWEDEGSRWCHSCDVNLRVCDWYKEKNISRSLPCNGARLDKNGDVVCRACDLSMGLGSSSLTMVELARAYSAFGTYGTLVEPHFIERVVDRDGTVIEEHEPTVKWPQVLEPSAAGVAHWLLRGVATGGTAAKSNRLGIQLAGKTGTTNSFRDAWFVGYNPDMVTAVWVGFDQPKNMGQTFTGGDTSLPIWMDFMRVAVPKAKAPRFKEIPNVDWAPIDETTGLVSEGGRSMPFMKGTMPGSGMGAVGQVTAQDLLTSDF